MPAYMIFTRLKTLDQSEMEEYWSSVGPTMEGHPVKVLVAYGAQQTLEGPETEGTVIAEFPNKQTALDWYQSPAYQKVMQHRVKGAIYTALLVEGVAPAAG